MDSWQEVPNEEGQKKVRILKANNEELPFSDCTFDSYISNFSLHLVTNHKNQILEAYRVLKEGSLAGFSVWGREDHCRNFTFLKSALKKLGEEFENNEEIKGAFHLNNKELLRKDCLDAGFKSVKVFTTTASISFESDEIFLNGMVKFEFDKFIAAKKYDAKKKEELWGKVKEEYYIQFGEGTSDIVDFEAIVVIAKK